MDKRSAPKISKRLLQILSILVVISSLLAGCRFPWQVAPGESTPTSEDGGVKTSNTPEPRKDLPAALVEVSPLPGSVIGLAQPITLTFNQDMDKSSVEGAIRFDPAIAGAFAWEDTRTLVFTPDQALAPGSSLVLRINTSAQADNQENLQDSVEIIYQTTERLQVLQAVPSEGSEDVDPESAIFVAFNQPVVALGAEADAAPAFNLSPDVPGEGQWLNTSTYIFYPAPSMAGGTTYTVRINDTLESTAGASLDSGAAGGIPVFHNSA